MCKVIVIVNRKGGIGKTCTVRNLSYSLAELTELNTGRPVIIVRGRYSSNIRAGGHVTVIYGYEFAGSSYKFMIRDPWPLISNSWPSSHSGQSYTWFFNQVNHEAVWNIKYDYIWLRQITVPFLGAEQFYYNGLLMNAADSGNYMYGYCGRGLGLGNNMIYWGGVAHIKNISYIVIF